MEITASILPVLILLPFLGFVFILMVQNNHRYVCRNIIAVAEFTVLINILMLWCFFSKLDLTKKGLQFTSTYLWTQSPRIEIGLGIDIFSLMILLAVHMVMVVGLPFLYRSTHPKRLGSVSMLLLSIFCGLLLSADIFSFYICFTAMPIILILLMSGNGEVRKSNLLSRFFIYNFMGGVILLLAVCALYYCQQDGQIILLNRVARLNLPRAYEYWIWSGIFIALLSRVPIWPFHYFIATINTKIRNPLVFLEVSLLSLSGLYGLYRFWPNYIPLEISQHFVWINVIGILTMLFISLIGFSNSDSQYRIFAYSTIYYIMYLLGIFSQNKGIYANLNYALFGFLLVLGGLEVVSSYIRRQEQLFSSTSQGFLCRAHRLSLVYSFLVFSAVGFPVSSMFTNNFLILSQLLSVNIHMGSVLVLSWMLVSVSLIIEMLRLKTDAKECLFGKSEDLPKSYFIFMLFIIFMLLMSFIHPLWFVINT